MTVWYSLHSFRPDFLVRSTLKTVEAVGLWIWGGNAKYDAPENLTAGFPKNKGFLIWRFGRWSSKFSNSWYFQVPFAFDFPLWKSFKIGITTFHPNSCWPGWPVRCASNKPCAGQDAICYTTLHCIHHIADLVPKFAARSNKIVGSESCIPTIW